MIRSYKRLEREGERKKENHDVDVDRMSHARITDGGEDPSARVNPDM